MPSNLLMVQKGERNKGKGKGMVFAGKTKAQAKPAPKPYKEKNPKDVVCYFWNEFVHWKRNLKLYLEDLESKKSSVTISSGIYVIDLQPSIT